MNTQVFKFNEYEITFESKDLNVMINATQMAKAFGKRIDFFLKSEHAKEFIKVLELTPFGGRSEPLKRDEIIKTQNGVSTYFHKILALKFASWLDPKFELWVYTAIEHLLFGHYEGVDNSLRESAKRKKEIDVLRKELYDSETYKNLEKLEWEEKKAARWRSNQNTKQLRLFMGNN